MDKDFPGFVSFTVTNACNLRCQMCAQWSPEGYMHGDRRKPIMTVASWKQLVDEVADRGIKMILIRGGEPFLMPGIIELLEHIAGTRLATTVSARSRTVRPACSSQLQSLGRVRVWCGRWAICPSSSSPTKSIC